MNETDSLILRRAATILRRNSSKPNGLWLNVLCRVLTDTADKLDESGPSTVRVIPPEGWKR